MCAKYRRSVRFRPSRFNGTIDVDAGLTIYMWSGKPVAYLEKVVTVHEGGHVGPRRGAACATAQVMTSGTQGEPGKAGQQGQPCKAGTEGAPGQPGLRSSFGDTPCEFLLSAGRN
jgi:hypothetical protein